MEDLIIQHPVAFVLLVAALLTIPLIFLAVKKKPLKEATADLEKATESRDEKISGCFFLAFLVFLVVAIPIAPHLRNTALSKEEQGRAAELSQMGTLVFAGDQIRIEPRWFGNVIVWVERSSFERIPYPDRDGAVKQLAQAWCPAFHTLPFFPSLYVKDIRNGKRLASRLCR